MVEKSIKWVGGWVHGGIFGKHFIKAHYSEVQTTTDSLGSDPSQIWIPSQIQEGGTSELGTHTMLACLKMLKQSCDCELSVKL